MKKNIKLIALGTTRMVGKDTFFSILNDIKPNTFRRYAFADELKEYCNPLCRSIFDKPIHKLNSDEKELFRPILIETGKICRSIDIDYWVKKTRNNIQFEESVHPYPIPDIPVITDLRFMNEFLYLKKVYEDSMIFINIERNGSPEPTYEEKKHAPELKQFADIEFFWETEPSTEKLVPLVRSVYEKIFN